MANAAFSQAAPLRGGDGAAGGNTPAAHTSGRHPGTAAIRAAGSAWRTRACAAASAARTGLDHRTGGTHATRAIAIAIGVLRTFGANAGNTAIGDLRTCSSTTAIGSPRACSSTTAIGSLRTFGASASAGSIPALETRSATGRAEIGVSTTETGFASTAETPCRSPTRTP